MAVVDQNIGNQQDIFKYIIQRSVKRIHTAIGEEILIDQAEHQRENRQHQGRGFLC